MSTRHKRCFSWVYLKNDLFWKRCTVWVQWIGNRPFHHRNLRKNIHHARLWVDRRFVRSTLLMIEFGLYVLVLYRIYIYIYIYTYVTCFCDSGRRRGCRTFSQIVTFRFGMYAFIHAHVRTYSSRSRYGRAVGPLENIADSSDTMPWSLNCNKHKTLISSREHIRTSIRNIIVSHPTFTRNCNEWLNLGNYSISRISRSESNINGYRKYNIIIRESE